MSSWIFSGELVDEVGHWSFNRDCWAVPSQDWLRRIWNAGHMRIVLYDERPGSYAIGLVNEFRLGAIHPGLEVLPARIWHGVLNIGSEPSSNLNIVDKAFDNEAPGHWRLPPVSGQILFSFSGVGPGDS